MALIALLSFSCLGGEQTIQLEIDGVTRSAVVYIPDVAKADQPLPLILAFHGSAWNARLMQQTTGFSDLAEREKFIVVYPNGSGPSNILSWNADYCCSFALEQGVDDLLFIDLLLETLIRQFPVDESRIYATGFSNGGMLTYKLALQRPNVFAAFAIVSGAMYASQQQTGIPVPILIIHGTNDPVIPYTGGWGTLRTLSGKTEPAMSASEATAFWIANNGCSGDPPTTTSERTARIQAFNECAEDTDVVFITISDGGHEWPVVRQNSSSFLLTDDAVDLFTDLADISGADTVAWDVFEVGLDASQTIWEFFQSH